MLFLKILIVFAGVHEHEIVTYIKFTDFTFCNIVFLFNIMPQKTDNINVCFSHNVHVPYRNYWQFDHNTQQRTTKWLHSFMIFHRPFTLVSSLILHIWVGYFFFLNFAMFLVRFQDLKKPIQYIFVNVCVRKD